MRRAFVGTAWAVVLGGCYGPGIAENVPCGPDGECPNGQSCDFDGRCRSEPLPDAAMDLDNDGVDDSVDNCLTVENPKQFDEDGDTVGNECDNCPHVANTDQASTTDVDDTGDACDGNAMTRERLVHFQGFDERPEDWDMPAGWRTQNGQLVAETAGGVATWIGIAPPTLIVQARGTFMGNATASANTGVLVRATDTSFYRCSISPVRADLAKHQAGTTTLLASLDRMTAFTTFDVAAGIVNSTVLCIVRGDEAMNAEQLTANEAVPLTGTRTGVRSNNATVRFDYFIAYTIE